MTDMATVAGDYRVWIVGGLILWVVGFGVWVLDPERKWWVKKRRDCSEPHPCGCGWNHDLVDAYVKDLMKQRDEFKQILVELSEEVRIYREADRMKMNAGKGEE